MPFPPTENLATTPILKQLIPAHAALAELKGIAHLIPNQEILISTLALQEAKESSAIENIVTTHDELYKSDATGKKFSTPAAKEVYNYLGALRTGYHLVQENGILTTRHILSIQEEVVQNNAGFRKLPGTELKNDQTGETIYTPPQDPEEITTLMSHLEQFINGGSPLDPLLNMAIIHHQFETIHPFYDGNGRTGRILNVLYLVKEGLLETPILYLSRYINERKSIYYRLLQAVRTSGQWTEWLLFMLEAIEHTSRQTSQLIRHMHTLMQETKHHIRSTLPKLYSHDLLNCLFTHPYTKPLYLEHTVGIAHTTATRHLNNLARIGIMEKVRAGKETYYVHTQLVSLLTTRADQPG